MVIDKVKAIAVVIEAGLNVQILPAYPIIVIAVQAGRVIGIVKPINA